MPTPFTHLLAASTLLDSADMPPATREVLVAEWPAFLLGNIAPDVQTISGQTREATHFFPVPLNGAPLAHQVMFELYPELTRPQRLPAAQTAFLAGYLAHLAFDQLWITEIFAPVFGPEQTWATFRERLYLHNALRAYLDAADLAQLPAPLGSALHLAGPERWLPFVKDDDLARWRDRVADQLVPGAASHTVTVFAERMRVDPRALAALVNSPAEMDQRIFVHVSQAQVEQYRQLALTASAQLIRDYWGGKFS
jgi:hypothetical protein